MLDSARRMVADHPLFGVGIGQYSLWSYHYASPELLRIYKPRDNAHNNFAQLAGETGIVGFLPFLWVLGVALWKGLQASRTDRLAAASMLGLLGFIITWLGGHPLLVPGAAYSFWVVLGLAAGAGFGPPVNEPAAVPGARPVAPRVPAVVPLAVSAILLIGSVPARVETRMQILDFARVSYGFYDWERGPAGERLRWTGPRARLFARPDAETATIPFRAAAVSRDNPIVVDILVDGQREGQVRLENSNWQTVRLALPPSSRLRVIDILPSRSWIPAEVLPGSTDTRRLGVQVGQVQIEPANGGS
jgi:hypothetical protein